MQLPAFIRETTEKLASAYSPTQLKHASARLSDVYLGNKGDGARLVTGKLQATVYSVVRMPATYCAVFSALKATADCADFSSMLDIGAGTGAAFFAAHGLFGIKEATLVERERQMISLARTICEAGGLNAKTVESDVIDFSPDEKYDLVTASYALNEMTEKTREKLLDKLLAATGKLLVIVEPGTPQAFSLQREIRSYLSAKGARLVAPCPDGAACSLPDNDWCHFTCRVERSRLHKLLKGGDAPYEDEKFTYSAFCVDGSVSACDARVLRHPVTEKGRITLSLCSSEGVTSLTLYKKDEGYKEARKLGAGDAFPRPDQNV